MISNDTIPGTKAIVTGDVGATSHEIPTGTAVFIKAITGDLAHVQHGMRSAWVALRDMVTEEAEVDRLVTEANKARIHVIEEFDAFKEKVRDQFMDMVRDDSLDRERANEALTELGLPELRPLREVIIREPNGEDLIGPFYEVDSDLSDEDLIEEVRSLINVDATILKVRFDVSCRFDGEYKSTSTHWEDDECGGSGPDDSFIDDFVGNLEIIVGES